MPSAGAWASGYHRDKSRIKVDSVLTCRQFPVVHNEKRQSSSEGSGGMEGAGLAVREVFVAGPEPASPGTPPPQPSATKPPPDATRGELQLKRGWEGSDKERWRLKKLALFTSSQEGVIRA